MFNFDISTKVNITLYWKYSTISQLIFLFHYVNSVQLTIYSHIFKQIIEKDQIRKFPMKILVIQTLLKNKVCYC